MAKPAKKSEIMADLNQFLQQFYSDPLEKAGFVPCGNSMFDWYKAEHDLLYGVHFPIHGPTSPFIYLEAGISALPLFVWDEIPMHMPINENYWGRSGDRFRGILTTQRQYLDLIEQKTGPLKRPSYLTPALIAGLPCGRNLYMLDSERRGAEVLDDIAFPLLSSLKSIEDVYRFNLEYRSVVDGFETVDQYLENLQKEWKEGQKREEFSIAFADECIAVRDEKMYPYILDSLELMYARCMKGLDPSAPWAKRNHKYYIIESERAALLIRVLRGKDYVLWKESADMEQEKMMQQIRKKLPRIQIAL